MFGIALTSKIMATVSMIDTCVAPFLKVEESIIEDKSFSFERVGLLNEYDLVGVKTTGLGSMYKLSYHIVLKNGLKDKNLIDELRIMNGNLEISLVPYAIDNEGL